MVKKAVANLKKERDDWSKRVSRGAKVFRRLANERLSFEELQMPIDDPEMRKDLVKLWQTWPSRHFQPLSDDQVPLKYETSLLKWLRLASRLGYIGPVVWQVRAGYILLKHAPMTGPCYKKWQHLQGWKLRNDEPTKDLLVFWIPRLVTGSKGKKPEEQTKLMAEIRSQIDLPEHHLMSFGSAALLSGLILTHYKRTGEKTPLNGEWTRTDTFHADGNRLPLGDFGGSGLCCGSRDWDEGERSALGCFPLGVEPGI